MKLKNRQRMAVLVGLLIAVVMGLFPPWEHKYGRDPVRYFAQGYHFIGLKAFTGWLPMANYKGSEKATEYYRRSGWRIDTTTLWVQWLTVAFATAAAVTLLGDWSKPTLGSE